MFDVLEFDMSLKITWLYKVTNPDNERLEFALAERIDRLIWTGDSYHSKLLETAKNPFCRSVIIAYKSCLSEGDKIPICFIPIWGNPILKLPFNNNLYKKGLIFLSDLIDHTGNLMTKQVLEARLECNIIFTTYYALLNCIPREWKDELREYDKTYNLTLPPILETLMKCEKGTQAIRQIWISQRNTITPVGRIK